MYNIEKRSSVPENAAGFVRRDTYMYGPITKWHHWGMFLHWGNKPNDVRVGIPPALSSWRFRYLSLSLYMAGIHRCPVSSARSTQGIGGKNKKKIITLEYQKFPLKISRDLGMSKKA